MPTPEELENEADDTAERERRLREAADQQREADAANDEAHEE